MDEDELPPLDEQPDESALATEAAWQRLQLERQQRLSAAPSQQQPQGPAGAQTYDRAAELIAAGRKGPQEVARVLRARGFDVEGYGGPIAAVEQRKPLLSAAPPDVQLPAPNVRPVATQPDVQLPTPNVQPVATQPAAPQAAAPQDDYKAQLAALMDRLEQSRAAQEAEINAGYERSRPSESEKWLAIAAALASPTQHGSFGEVMGNVFQSLLGYKQGVRGAENTRQQQLAQLRRAYDLEGTRALARGLKPPTAVAPFWSERFGRTIPKDRVVPVETGVDGKGNTVIKYSDGTMGIRQPDSSIVMYDADGAQIGIRAGGDTQ